jgi:hypothetical protein
VNDLTDIVNLAKTTILANDQTISQQANAFSSWTTNATYAGYIYVRIDNSTTNNNYVQVIYSSLGGSSSHVIDFNQTLTIDHNGGWASFPVLPSSNIEIRVGNTNLVNSATETVTIACYY